MLPTLPDIDIWRSAHVMMKRYGDDAAKEANERVRRCLELGDQDGAAVWCRIRDAIIQWDESGREGLAN